jgi:beta-1,4-mannosyl-glycoprotein beta-1,4-N-acetylglucosaminyltransferase
MKKKLYDCFLINDEVLLLKIRLNLLFDVVDYFVIVQSKKTFTNLERNIINIDSLGLEEKLKKKIKLVTLETLKGKNAWERETYSRKSFSLELLNLNESDLVMISDIDEIPRPEVLSNLKEFGLSTNSLSLVLDNFNFKFNFKQIAGLDAEWPGPVLTTFSNFKDGQASRNSRWENLQNNEVIYNAGWHFSYLTCDDNIGTKLMSFSHQEYEIQNRKALPSFLVRRREGFHDHIRPGCIWAVVDIKSLESPNLEIMIQKYTNFLSEEFIDSKEIIDSKIKKNIHILIYKEKLKLLHFYSFNELFCEIKIRILRKLFKKYYLNNNK